MNLSTIINILIAILAFGVIIFVHELGHFIAAKKSGVRVNEFAIGMGPTIFKTKKGDTQYAIRLFPIGGFVSMEGEDEESDDEASFQNKSAGKRLIILAAGAVMNLLLGVIVLVIMLSTQNIMTSTTISKFKDNALTNQTGLKQDDTILSVDGHKVFVANDLLYLVLRTDDGTVDMVVERDGKDVELKDVTFKRIKTDGNSVGTIDVDFYVKGLPVTFGNVVSQTGNWFCYMARTVWLSIWDLLTGRFGINEMSGPVGATAAITQATAMGFGSFLTIMAFIAINVGIFNLLPIPALDGGRIFFVFIELVTRRKVPAKYEGFIHFAGIVVLMGLIVFLTFNDIARLIGG